MERVAVECEADLPSRYKVKDDIPSRDVVKDDIPSRVVSFSGGSRTRFTRTQWMLAINEIGIYEALFASRRLEARKFRRWSASVMQRLRREVGLEQYEVMKMTYPEVQEDIDHILDTLFYDEETRRLMRSVTVQGGDVEQVPFEF